MGLLSIAAALLNLYEPLVVSVLLFTVIAPSVIFIAVLEIVAGQVFKQDLVRTNWLTAGGVVSLVLGLLLLIQPFVGFTSLENLVGLIQIVRGVVNVVLAFVLKLNREKMEEIMESGL
jgi:uncharacterized membrane protein HdeD (DUF308 family)